MLIQFFPYQNDNFYIDSWSNFCIEFILYIKTTCLETSFKVHSSSSNDLPISIGVVAEVVRVIIKRYNQKIGCDEIELFNPAIESVTQHRTALPAEQLYEFKL